MESRLRQDGRSASHLSYTGEVVGEQQVTGCDCAFTYERLGL